MVLEIVHKDNPQHLLFDQKYYKNTHSLAVTASPACSNSHGEQKHWEERQKWKAGKEVGKSQSATQNWKEIKDHIND